MTTSDPTGSAAPVVLGGRYEVHRRLARGGMAEVFLARDQALDRPVAVKILFPEYATDPAFVERFRREAQAAANLSHPNIVGVYDWGSESGTYYIVMEYVEGQSLAEVVRDAGPLHPRRAAEIIFEVAGALGFAHQRGVVHRDVKPGNVLISTSGTSKVTDFGIARALSSPADDLTQAGSVMGTATYFSPEQAQGFPVDARSDLYSLGVVLYEILCGRPPFVGDSPVAIAYKHVQEWPPRPSQFVTGVPAGLESVILKLLAKKPEQRYRSADDLRADLRRFLDGQTTVAEEELARPAAAAAPVAAAAAATVVNPTVTADPSHTTVMPVAAAPIATDPLEVDDQPPARTGLFVAVTLLLLAGLAALGFWLVTSLNDNSTDTGDTVLVTDTVGMTQDDAIAALKAQGFNPTVQEEASDVAVAGTVIRQSPAANTRLAKGKDVLVFVSTGPANVAVPPVADLTEAAARKALVDAGFVVKVEQFESDTVPAGSAVETVPATGTPAPNGSEVLLRISTGAGSEAVPVVTGKTVDQATKALTDKGFVVGEKVLQASADVKKDLVITTDPVGSAPKKSTVNLIVSTGAEPVKVPAVKGQREDEATTLLKSKGFDVSVEPKALPAGDANDGRVISVDPAAGTSLDAGSTVTITVGVAGAATTTSSPATTSTTTTSP